MLNFFKIVNNNELYIIGNYFLNIHLTYLKNMHNSNFASKFRFNFHCINAEDLGRFFQRLQIIDNIEIFDTIFRCPIIMPGSENEL